MLLFGCSIMSNSFWPHGMQHTSFPVRHLPELAQTHVHWVNDAIQPSHPLSSPSPPALNLSQHQGLFQRVGSSHQLAKLLELQLQHQFFQWIFRVDFLRTDWLDLLVVQGTLKGLLQHHNLIGGRHAYLQLIASRSETQVTAWTCNWWLKYGGEGQSCRTEPLIWGIKH